MNTARLYTGLPLNDMQQDGVLSRLPVQSARLTRLEWRTKVIMSSALHSASLSGVA